MTTTQPTEDSIPSQQQQQQLDTLHSSCADAVVAETTKRRKTAETDGVRHYDTSSTMVAPDKITAATDDTDVQIRTAHRVLTAQKALLDQEAATLRTKITLWQTALTELQRQCKHPHDQRYKTFSVYADTEWHCPSCGRVFVQ